MKKFDLAIIGSGSAGYVAGIRAAQLGSSVCVVEKDEIGGICLNRGCIPTKAILATVNTFNAVKGATNFGVKAEKAKLDFKYAMQRKTRIVQKLKAGIEFLLKQNRIEVIHGTAVITEPGCLKVGNNEIKSKSIIIATGSVPIMPFKIDRVDVVTSDEALNFDEPPKSILIIGGGAIGVEFATIFSGCGSKVILVEMLPRILPEVKDEKIVVLLKRNLERQGLKVLEGVKVNEITNTPNGILSLLSNNEKILTDKVLVACGRVPNSCRFESLGLKLDGHRVVVDEHMQTNILGIYAAGDVTGSPLLAHKASKEGEVAAENASGLDSKIDYNSIPNCIFSNPEIAYVGKFGAELDCAIVGEYPFEGIGKALCIGEATGFVKVIADKVGKVKGVQIIGPHASDLIEIGVIGVKMGLSADELGDLIYPHPTLSECLKEALLDVTKRAIHKTYKKVTNKVC
ncbi:MAG: dihydrolipoyl dehydrogenase [bacterium]|nr:dihydrolipoyl dehydrogenase [bacterium]